MSEKEALRMMVEFLYCSGFGIEEGRKEIDWYTKTDEGKERLKKNYDDFIARGGTWGD